MRDFDPTASEFISSGYIARSRPGGVLYDPTTLAVGGSVASGLMGSDASSSAADAQVQSARDSNKLQKDMFDKQVQLQEPFRRGGLAAQNRLLTLLGLAGTPGGAAAAPRLDANALRAQLLPKYTRAGAQVPQGAGGGSGWSPDGGNYGGDYSGQQPGGGVDEAGLQAEIERQMGAQGPEGDGLSVDSSDPAYGSLMKDFTAEDFLANQDPGYQFRMEQGTQALDRSASARGGIYSGRAAKDLLRFGQGLGSQEYGAAYNRFQTNRSNKLNPLQSLMGAGQTSANQVGQAAQSYGSNAGANIVQAGNARASGYVGGANALSGAIGQGYNMYQGNQMLDIMNRRAPSIGGDEDWRNTGNGMPSGYISR